MKIIKNWIKFNESKTEPMKFYNSHGGVFTISDFIDIEIKERHNYTKRELNKWMKKYNLDLNSEVMWVVLKPETALIYAIGGDPYSPLEENLINISNRDEVTIDELLENEICEIKSFKENLIIESDDSAEGYLLIFDENVERIYLKYSDIKN